MRTSIETWSKADVRAPRHGWAPGKYMNTCRECSTAFVGDKRAWHCAPCAYSMPDAEPAKPRYVPPPLVYLATPYTHPDPAVRLWRFEQVNKAAARLMVGGVHVFSPISQTHPIALAAELPTHWEYWEEIDRAMISRCAKLIVLMLPGWRESKGVQAEIRIARELGLPVEYLGP